jgi:DDE family transposase
MPARLPLQAKTPFHLDAKPLEEMGSAHAGLLAASRALRSLGVPVLADANLQLKARQRGLTPGQSVETLLLLQIAGGDCPEDLSVFQGDVCLERGLGYALPKVRTVRDFLDRFHDESLESLRPEREVQKSFILPPSSGITQLQAIQAGLVGRIAKHHEQAGERLKSATIDQDATIIESHKQNARSHYEGGRGYQPMVAVWAEADLVVADEFRDGNVPAKQEPLTCAQLAFAALPDTVEGRYFRGDSACHENDLIQWLKDPDRQKEKGGAIGFAISAVMSAGLQREVQKVAEKQWQTIKTEADGTLRQWTEVPFVPGEPGEKKDSQPLRYVGLRLLKPQGELFADGADRHHHAVVTNLDWAGARLLQWHREKAGTIEHVHDEVKNALGGGHLPSQHFNANAAWFKLALMAYNIVSAMRRLCLEPQERTVRLKKFRLLVLNVAGRMSRFQCTLRLRLCAAKTVIARLMKIWEVFELPTQATAFK